MATSSATAATSIDVTNFAESSCSEVPKRKSEDIGRKYAIFIDTNNYDKVQCRLCGKKFSGGVHRVKKHIGQIKGDVSSCTKATKEDQELCYNAIAGVKLKRQKKKNQEESMRSEVNIDKAIDVEKMEESFGGMKPPSLLGPMDKFANIIDPSVSLGLENNKRQQVINDTKLFKERTEAVKAYVCRWAYEAGVSFNCLELDSFKMMMEAVGQFGPGFKPPTRYEIAGPFLKKEVDRTKDSLKKHEDEWKLNGCSIMTDAWSDRKRRSIMNLCVNSRLGTVFLSSKDSSDIAHTSEVICEYVEKCIQEVGPEHVVQIVTDNASNNMAAANLLKDRRPKIFWTSCAAHTINLMLEGIAKQPRFKKVLDQAKSLTIFLYAHHKVLAMMRSHTKKRDVVRPGVTRFASSFLTLQSLHEKRAQLKTMFGSPEWEQCKFSKSVKGKAAYATVMSMGFWSGVALSINVFTPLVKVLRIADCDRKPSMGFVFGELVQARDEIKNALNNIPKNYEPIIEIIDEKMKNRLDSPLHLMAYILNPFYHYKDPLLHLDQDVSLGVIECLDVFFPGDVDMQNKIMSDEFPKYTKKDLTFGKALAAKACSVNDFNFDPVTWWSNFGAITPHLQRLAMRILSLTTSSSGCERNWSSFEGVHTKKRNRLDTNLLNNLVFVQFNAKLLSKQTREKDRTDVEVLFAHDSTNAQEWIVDGVDDEGEVGDDMPMGDDETALPRRSSRIRELYEDDFESEDEEINENEVHYESDGDVIVEDHGEP